jgi:hypothetical protein
LIALLSALLGIAAAAISYLGLLYGARKSAWLRDRLYGERLRQFHFQELLASLPEIAASMTDQRARDAYAKARAVRFARFRSNHTDELDAVLTALLSPDGAMQPWTQEPLLTPPALPGSFDATELFAAYRTLRLQVQHRFASHKLRRELPRGGIGGTLDAQRRVFTGLWLLGILTVVVLHGALLVCYLLDELPRSLTTLHIGVVLCALFAIAMRTLYEGRGIRNEIDRYETYRAATRQLLDRFDRSHDPANRLQVMHEMEQLSFEELRSFLRTHKDATFVM